MTYEYIDHQAPDSIIPTDRVYPVGVWHRVDPADKFLTFDQLPGTEEISSPEEAMKMISFLNGGEAPDRIREENYLLIVQPNSVPRITGPWSLSDLDGKAKLAFQGYNKDMPVKSMHRTQVFHLEWKRHHFPHIKPFPPYVLGEIV